MAITQLAESLARSASTQRARGRSHKKEAAASQAHSLSIRDIRRARRTCALGGSSTTRHVRELLGDQRDARGVEATTAGSGSRAAREAATTCTSRIRSNAGDRGGASEDRRGRRKRSRTCCAPGFCRGVHRPPELRDLRELLRHRAVLTGCAPRSRTACTRCWPPGHLPEHSDLFGKSGREFLAGWSCRTARAGAWTADGADR